MYIFIFSKNVTKLEAPEPSYKYEWLDDNKMERNKK